MLQWIEASTLDELQSALVQGYRVIGGGTGLLGTENPVDKVVDIRRFPAANQIVDHPSHWQLGPVVTLAHLQAWAKPTFRDWLRAWTDWVRPFSQLSHDCREIGQSGVGVRFVSHNAPSWNRGLDRIS